MRDRSLPRPVTPRTCPRPQKTKRPSFLGRLGENCLEAGEGAIAGIQSAAAPAFSGRRDVACTPIPNILSTKIR